MQYNALDNVHRKVEFHGGINSSFEHFIGKRF